MDITFKLCSAFRKNELNGCKPIDFMTKAFYILVECFPSRTDGGVCFHIVTIVIVRNSDYYRERKSPNGLLCVIHVSKQINGFLLPPNSNEIKKIYDSVIEDPISFHYTATLSKRLYLMEKEKLLLRVKHPGNTQFNDSRNFLYAV